MLIVAEPSSLGLLSACIHVYTHSHTQPTSVHVFASVIRSCEFIAAVYVALQHAGLHGRYLTHSPFPSRSDPGTSLGLYITMAPALSAHVVSLSNTACSVLFDKEHTLLPFALRVRDSHCFACTACLALLLSSDVEKRRDLRPQTTARPDSRLIRPMTLLTQ
jgi:hypothetical protein